MLVIDANGRVIQRSGDGRQAIVWADSQPRLVIPYDDAGLVTEDVDLSAGGILVRIGRGSRVSQAGDGAPLVIDAGATRITIETAGPRAGILTFETTRTVAEVDLSIRYFYRTDAGAFAGFRFRIFSATDFDEAMRTEISIDPNHVTDPARTFLRTFVPSSFTSTLLTPTGAAITLTPAGGQITSAMAYDPTLNVFYETPNGTWLIAGAGRSAVMLGLSGAEAGGGPAGSGVTFVAGRPAFAPSFLKPTNSVGDPLISKVEGSPQDVTTAWISFDTRGATGGYYSSAPSVAPLFKTRADKTILEPFDDFPVLSFGADTPAPILPAAPYAGFFAPPADPSSATLLRRFENELLAPARTRTALNPADGPRGFGDSTAAAFQVTTPQGVYSQFDAKGDWKVKDIAQSVLQRGFPLEINDILRPLRDALFANQLFLVISSAELFSRLASTAYFVTEEIAAALVEEKLVRKESVDALRRARLIGVLVSSRADFESQLKIALKDFPNDVPAYLGASQFAQLNVGGWKFNLAPASWNPGTILIIKASEQSFPAMAANLEAWALPGKLNSDPVKTQERLLEFIADARKNAPDQPDLRYFVDTVLAEKSATSSVWNGILYLNVSVPASTLPSALRGLISGFPPDTREIPAHHMGINTSSFRLFNGMIVPGNSSVFGLVAYQADIKPPSPGEPPPYAFNVISLRAEVVNSVLVSFSSEIELIINKLFGEPAKLEGKSTAPDPNAIVLVGQLQQHADESTFTFTFEGANKYSITSNILSSVTITGAQFVTLGATGAPPDQTPPVTSSQFILDGDLEFKQPKGFDPLSFGGNNSSLAFDNLLITLNEAGQPATFFFDASQIDLDDATSLARAGSLFERFPLALSGMLQGESDAKPVTPESLGYLPVRSPGSATTAPAIWFGLLYDLNLGSAGALAPLLNFSAGLLVTWAPDGKALSLFLRIPGTGNTVRIEGPITLTLNDLAFEYDDTNGDYLLLFTAPVFRYLGTAFLGPRTPATFVLFGNPNPGGTKTLGWYVSQRSRPLVDDEGQIGFEGPLNVDFFGLSHNLIPRGGGIARSVTDVLELMKESFFPLVATNRNPLPQLPELKFSGAGNWLVGIEATFFDTLSLSVVFADHLRSFGLHGELTGSIAGKLEELQFDALYTRVTDTIGLYHFAFQPPDSKRTYSFGKFEFTIPAVLVDIFTNGDFRVDAGFPDGLNFDRSFALTVGGFTGKGGFFFGRYNAVTSPIPQPLNGTFAPVVELGIALSFGREFTYPPKAVEDATTKPPDPTKDKEADKSGGLISGKAGLALVGIVQGVFAPFNPNDRAVSTGLYHRISGTIGIIGILEGAVDLFILKVSICIEASASATLIFEAGEPTIVQLALSVEVEARIRLFFFTISISFRASVDLSFTILPALITPPWILPGNSDSRRRFTPAQLQRLAANGGSSQPDFTPVSVFGDSKRQVAIDLMPALTVAFNPGTSANPKQQVVMLLMARNSVDPSAANATEVRAKVMEAAETAPFNVLAQSMLLWSIAAQTGRKPHDGKVSAAELQAIAAYLADPANRDKAFPYPRISDFLGKNLEVRVSIPADLGKEVPGTIFPMAPPLSMTPKDIQKRDFSTYHSVGDAYIDDFQKYFADLAARARDAAGGPHGLLENAAPQSFAQLIFADYFGLLASESTRAAAETLDAFPFQPTGASGFNKSPIEIETLQSISDLFPKATLEYRTRPGDTPVSVAAALRVTLSELLERNEWLRDRAAAEPLPVNSLVVAEAGPTVPAIVERNPSYPLASLGPLFIDFPELPFEVRLGDTLRSIAAPADPVTLFPRDGANQTGKTLLAAGRSLRIPGERDPYVIREEDSFIDVARQFPGDPQRVLEGIVSANADDSRILRPLSIFAKPPFRYQLQDGDTLASLAMKFGLTLDEIAKITKQTPGLLRKYEKDRGFLVVPNVAERETSKLVDDLVRTGAFNNLAGMASRILLDGLRVPKLADDGHADFKELRPLYDMIGTQFQAPPQPPAGAPYPVFFDNGNVDWLKLAIGPTIVPRLEVELGRDFFQHPPDSTLNPQIIYGPSAMQLYEDVPPRFPLPQNIEWQNADRVSIPGQPEARGLSLRPFNDALQNAAIAGATGPYELGSIESAAPPYAWATAIPVRIRQAASTTGEPLPNSYVVVGTGQGTRNMLLQAAEYVAKPGNNASLYLLHPPSAGRSSSTGVISDGLIAAKTFVLKTNLTRVTSAPVASALAADRDHALITDVAGFLQLLWEASVTGSGGFYLNYTTEVGEGLPPAIFADGQVDLWLLLLLESQSRQVSPDRFLKTFNNCAVAAGNPGALFVDEPKGAPQRQPIVGPGTVGFSLARTDPTDVKGATAQQLYSLLSYKLQEAPPLFAGSNEGFPVGPAHGPTALAKGQWFYTETIPISRFGKVNDAPESIALPPANANPYRGIAAPSGKLGSTTVSMNFHDLYGNTTEVKSALEPLSLAVGYTDVLTPISAWPASSYGYRFESGVTLATVLSLDTTRFVPDASTSAGAAQVNAAAAATQYASIFYQVQQHDLGFTLTSNIGTPKIDGDELKASLQAFVSKATVFTKAAASLTGVTATTSAIKFGDFATQLSLTPGAIAVANANLLVSELFVGPVINPQFVVAEEKDTLLKLAAKLAPGVTPGKPQTCPPEAPSCRSGSAAPSADEQQSLTPEELARQNATQPLTPGIVLGVDKRPVVAGTKSLATLARETNSTVYSDFNAPPNEAREIGLYPLNANREGIICPQTITLKGRQFATNDKTKLSDVYDHFKDLYDNKIQPFVTELSLIPALFVESATLDYNSFVVPADPPFSLAHLPPGTGSIEVVAAFNARVENFYRRGTALYLGYRCCKPEDDDTIRTFATWANITTEEFGAVNSVTPLKAGKTIAVPGAVTFTDPDKLYSAYSPLANDSLQSIINAFTPGNATLIADINRNLPGIFRSGATFKLFDRTITTTALGSLQSVYAGALDARPGLTYPDFIAALAPIASIYRTNGVVIAPMTTPNGASINMLVERVNVDPVALVAANAALVGLLQEGRSIVASGKSLPIGKYETINTVIARFANLGVDVTIAHLVAAYGDDAKLLTATQPFLLPPNPTKIDSLFDPKVPPPSPRTEDSIIFPVDVAVRLDRPTVLVHPQFASVGDVASIASDINPIPEITPNGAVLDGFAEAFEKAFAQFRLKCAVSKGTGNAASGSGKIFAVNFGNNGIRSLKVDASSPQFYSVAPLSRRLIAGPATFRPYVSGSGLGKKPVTKNFDSVDLDNWLQLLLGTIDLAFTAPYAVAAFASTAPEGPAGFAAEEFTNLVQSKQQLAAGLGANVQPILKSGASTGFGFEAARKALAEQTLVRLADAYTTDAIVQFPVAVTSPFAIGVTGIYPPRAAGKVEPVQYSSTSATSLTAVAQVYAISPAYLAEVLAHVQGIVQVGITFTYNGERHTLDDNDTIGSLAAALKVQPPDENWPAWVAFIEGPNGIGGKELFLANATFPLTPVSRPMAATDSLDTFAAFIDRGVVDVGRGNQNRAGIFREGAKIELAGHQPYTVGKDDTLVNIAKSIQPPLNVDDLTLGVAGATAVFVAGEKLAAALVQPDVSFTTSKISLGNGGDTDKAIPELTFLLTTSQPARQRNVFLDLRFTISQIEYAISNLPGGYQASSWLTFVLPIGSGRGLDTRDIATDMPQTQVPIPLRAFPGSPLLIAQNGVASKPGNDDLVEAKKWTYTFEVETDLAAQDTARLQVIFTQGSLPPGQASDGGASGPDLFATLAGFIDAYPQLKNDLALLTGPGGSTNRVAAFALRALADLALETADALANRPQSRTAADAALETYRYAIAATIDAGNNLDQLRLTIEESPKGSKEMYPDISVMSPAGTFEPLTVTGPGRYKYPEKIPAGKVTHRYRFAERNAIRNKNAYAGIAVTRNENLIAVGPIGDGSSPDPMPTNDRFVYSTGPVNFPQGLTPFVDNQSRIMLNLDDSLEQQLAGALSKILDLPAADPSLITLLVSLSFPTASAGNEVLAASTPIRLVPQEVVGTSTLPSYAKALAQSIRDYLGGQPPPRAGRSLALDLTVFSVTPPRGPTSPLGPRGATATDPLKPVLRLRDVAIGPVGFADRKE